MTALEIYEIVAAVIGTFSVIAAVTPTPKDDEVASKLQKVLKKVTDIVHLLAFNVGGAKPLKGTKGLKDLL